MSALENSEISLENENVFIIFSVMLFQTCSLRLTFSTAGGEKAAWLVFSWF